LHFFGCSVATLLGKGAGHPAEPKGGLAVIVSQVVGRWAVYCMTMQGLAVLSAAVSLSLLMEHIHPATSQPCFLSQKSKLHLLQPAILSLQAAIMLFRGQKLLVARCGIDAYAGWAHNIARMSLTATLSAG
jgi:hypothetical protein